jgi:hypothetical protein
LTWQAVAKHLVVPERAGLVAARRQGREVRYAVDADRLAAAAAAMARAAARWDRRLAAIKRVAEAIQRERADARFGTARAGPRPGCGRATRTAIPSTDARRGGVAGTALALAGAT